MEKITIEFFEDHTDEECKGWKVSQGDKYANCLGFDEMLGLVAHITTPIDRNMINWMKTKEQHNAEHERFLEQSKVFLNTPC